MDGTCNKQALALSGRGRRVEDAKCDAKVCRDKSMCSQTDRTNEKESARRAKGVDVMYKCYAMLGAKRAKGVGASSIGRALELVADNLRLGVEYLAARDLAGGVILEERAIRGAFKRLHLDMHAAL